jgi:hypothetical protein
MDCLPTEKWTQVVSAPVEGNSINAIVRMAGVAKHTVLKLIEDMGCACAAYHHRNVRGLKVRASSVTKFGHLSEPKRRMFRLSRSSEDGEMFGLGPRLMPIRSFDQWILKEDRESRPRPGFALHALQLLPSPQDASGDTRQWKQESRITSGLWKSLFCTFGSESYNSCGVGGRDSMTKYDGQKFTKAAFVMEDCFFVNCVLTDCDLFYSGGDVESVNLKTENCRWHWRGPALRTAQLMGALGMLKAPQMPPLPAVDNSKLN